MRQLRKDIEQLNQKVLLFAAQPENIQSCERFMRIHPNVGKQLRHATPDGCHYAINCGVPLVNLRESVVDDLSEPDKLKLPSSARHATLPELLGEINLLSLHLAQRATWANPHLAALYFGLSKAQLEIVAAASLTDLTIYADRCCEVVELRGAGAPNLWERIMIGGKIGGPRGRRLSHDAALLSLQTATTC